MKALLTVGGTAVAAQAALVGLVEVVAAARRFLAGERPDAFPWEDRPEVELESGDVRLKLYTHYEPLYEAMLEEIGRAEERIFLETFLWQDDGWGNRLVDALAKKAREGSRSTPSSTSSPTSGSPPTSSAFRTG